MSLLAGRYRVEETLGTGGMARVVAATDELLGRRVAVKLLHEGMAADPVVRERIRREAQAAASLNHPNAVAVYDIGEHDGLPFIVMELVEGDTLADRVRAEGALPIAAALAVVDQVLAALEAAHARGLVHRDVKPANVLLPADGGPAKLGDFGIAKGMREAAGGLTATGQVFGTVRYVSPEQVSGRPATPRSDLYAAGIVAYELLAGVPPFDGEEQVTIALAHLNDEPVPLGDRRPDVPTHVRNAVARAMAKDAADRFPDAGAMRAALRGPEAAATVLLAGSGAGESGAGGSDATGATGASDAANIATTRLDASTQVLADSGGEPPAAPSGRRGRGAVVAGVVALVVLLAVGAALLGVLDGEDPAPTPTEPPPAPTAPPEATEPLPADPEPDDPASPAPADPEAPADEPPEPDPEPGPEPEPDPDPADEPDPDALAGGDPPDPRRLDAIARSWQA
jgi:eukaryotic-like serine/threonine-protein kinase